MKPEEAKAIIDKAVDEAVKEKATQILTFSVIINQGGIRALEQTQKESHK